MNHYKLFAFIIVFWWSLLCPSSLGFPSDVLYPAKNVSNYSVDQSDNSNVELKIHFKYLTFLNKYVD